MPRTICVVCIIVGLLCIADSVHADPESDTDRITKIRVESSKATRDHDADRIVASFAQTYQITTGSGKQFHAGPEKERDSWAEIFALWLKVDSHWKIQSTEGCRRSTVAATPAGSMSIRQRRWPSGHTRWLQGLHSISR